MNFIDTNKPKDNTQKPLTKEELLAIKYNAGVYQGLKWTVKMLGRKATHKETVKACQRLMKFLAANEKIDNIKVWQEMEKHLPKEITKIEEM